MTETNTTPTPEYASGNRDAYRVFAAALFGKPVEAIRLHERYCAKILALHFGYHGGSLVDAVTQVIWKFTVEVGPGSIAYVEMPRHAVVLTVAAQSDKLCLWARCTVEAVKETRRFWVFGTGHAIPYEDVGRYLGTALLHDGRLVLHVYDEPGRA